MNAPAKASDTVLERTRVREVTGIFHSRDTLDAAANQLLLMGFDRADIDVVAALDEIAKKLSAPYVAPQELADIPRTPRRPLIAGEDVTVSTIVIASTLGAIAAGATVLWMSFAGAGSAEIGIAAALFGLIAVRSPEQEALAQEVLLAHRAKAVRVHEIDLEKRPDDLPLATVRPDPRLGSEPLGHP